MGVRMRAKTARAKAKKVQQKIPEFQGWNTSDAEEIARRHWRGLSDVVAVEPLEADQPVFGSFRVRSTSGGAYDVEIRSLVARENSCGCPDWRVNGLGTCKHIEGALEALRRKGKRAFAVAGRAGSPRIELFPAIDGRCAIEVRIPGDSVAFPFASGLVAGDPIEAAEALAAASARMPEGTVRISRHIEPRLEEERRRRRRVSEHERFLADVDSGAATLDFLKHKLLPYQVEGMLHLAFGERALLADEMGLGKTVQAIAACELLRRLRGIERVLVVLPASLKAEWEDQIQRFTDLSVTIVSGPRAERLRQYAAQSFFILVNYEQVLIDREDINRIVGADIVILDEAQRIKNWQTKTAQAVKGLVSRYAFVLTGTPLENRIDEIYSIVQYLDPRLLGPLFRFNRDFYVLDDRGRATDYKNLALLHERLAPVMLRRRKEDVEGQLPGRTVDTYFVAMAEEQKLRYGDYEAVAARLAAIARRRPLTPKEFDRLQQVLACMRMICDTPYILDRDCRVCPKLDELAPILAELLADPERKIIIFSEWERMLDLVRELAIEMGVEFAWHSGSVPQDKRRVEIRRFKNDPSCRLFLSTDSGSVGLNLQVASAVINMDLPWNPAKLEQRIARAWRKHQTRAVTVVNLVSENSIEHRMVPLLAQKQGLADGVLDGRGDLAALKMPSGRAAMIERIAAMLGAPEPAPAPAKPPAQRFIEEVAGDLGDGVASIERFTGATGDRLLVVTTVDDAAERQRLADAADRAGIGTIEFVDHGTWETIRRLVEAGVVTLTPADEVLHRSAALAAGIEPAVHAANLRRRQLALDWIAQAERKIRMAVLLADGGFGVEALLPTGQAASLALRGLAIAADADLDSEPVEELADADLMEREAVQPHLPPGTVACLSAPSEDFDASRAAAQSLIDCAQALAAARWAA
jgi:superfamily II DNA or RNA helicase/microcompartment protein CcmK/EutM